jgi:hypothetical protein
MPRRHPQVLQGVIAQTMNTAVTVGLALFTPQVALDGPDLDLHRQYGMEQRGPAVMLSLEHFATEVGDGTFQQKVTRAGVVAARFHLPVSRIAFMEYGDLGVT